jgi:hypothetical protein
MEKLTRSTHYGRHHAPAPDTPPGGRVEAPSKEIRATYNPIRFIIRLLPQIFSETTLHRKPISIFDLLPMNKAISLSLFSAALVGGTAISASGQVLVNENFSSYDLSTPQTNLGTNWTRVGGGTGTLSAAVGPDGSQAVLRDASGSPATSPANAWWWTGSLLTVMPTDANPVVLTGDIYFNGNINQRTSIGFRNTPYAGADPLFEVGFNNVTEQANGLAVRHLGFGGASTGTAGWSLVASYATLGTTPTWIRTVSTFTSQGVVVTFDLGNNGTIEYTYTALAVASVYGDVFNDLRFGGVSALSSAGGASAFDNIRLEVVPEPSTYAAIFGGLALLGAIVYRRRMSAKK